MPEPDWEQVPSSRLSIWQHVQKLQQSFWKRWHQEYLHELTLRKMWHRGETNDIEIGTLVILRDDNAPSIQWSLGRVVGLHPTENGIVRVATIRTATGTYKRSVKCLFPLPKTDATRKRDPPRNCELSERILLFFYLYYIFVH